MPPPVPYPLYIFTGFVQRYFLAYLGILGVDVLPFRSPLVRYRSPCFRTSLIGFVAP